MKLEEMEAESQKITPSKADVPCKPCVRQQPYTQKPDMKPEGNHLYLVDKGDGTCEYQIMSEDGRLVPAEKW